MDTWTDPRHPCELHHRRPLHGHAPDHVMSVMSHCVLFSCLGACDMVRLLASIPTNSQQSLEHELCKACMGSNTDLP